MMKKQLTQFVTVAIVLFLFTSACSTSKNGTDKSTAIKQQTTGVYQSLADYLRRNPSVKILGTGEEIQVMLRGVDALGGNVEPLFVIDNTQVETYAQAIRNVDVNDIRSVQVLNMMEATSSYGLRGSRGAIVIRTKKN